MPFIIRNVSSTVAFQLQDQYVDLLVAPSEHVDLEQVFPEDSLYMSSVSPNALYTAIQSGNIVRRNDADNADIAAVNAFDDAIWRWSPTRGQKEALVGTHPTPSASKPYLTQGIFSIKVTPTGTERWGNISLLEGTNISISDSNGAFTFNSSIPYGTPVTLNPDVANNAGASTSAARSDHVHNVPAATAISIGASNAEGTSTSFARADHLHSILDRVKSGVVLSTSFTGNPKKATVTFSSAFAADYSIKMAGRDARTWTYENKTSSGFTINANANTALTGEVSWEAAAIGG